LTGTIRTFESPVRDRVLQRFTETVNGVAEAMGCRVEVDLQQLTPATVNHPNVSGVVQKTARELFPSALVDPGNYVTMGSEDFAFILEKAPGCFFFIGSANPEKGLDAGHHHPKFDFDETVLPQGAALMAASVLGIAEKLNSEGSIY
jgi:metal-dependent amidase/aminoacylase/carboxypeptidase family protein